MNLPQLDQAIKAVCPIDGVSIGRMDDPNTWRIDFRKEATDEQRGAALRIVSEQNSLEEYTPVSNADDRLRAMVAAEVKAQLGE